MPMIPLNGAFTKALPFRRNAMRIVKSHQPSPVQLMQSERVVQTMRSLRSRRHTLDLELQPVALFKMMNAHVERKQVFESVFVGN